jgi:glycosyltransferase involved in cell wall biosynthesis
MGIKIANILEEGLFGGPHARILAVAEGLINKGIFTTVFLPRNDSNEYRSMLVKYGIPFCIHHFHPLTRNKRALLSFFLFFFPELISLTRELRKGRYDVVHCNGVWQFKGLLAGKLAGARVVWHLNDTREIIVLKILFVILSRIFCDAVVAASENVKRIYASLYKSKLFVIQAPVDTRAFDPSDVKSCNPPLPRDGLNIVAVGNINPAKGFEYFLEMASIVNRRYQGLNFFIVGPVYKRQEPYYRGLVSRLNELELENCFFYGPSADVVELLRFTDIYVCSSVREASPIALWEAMSMARSIVSTDVGDVKYYIEDGVGGFIVQPGDAEALAEKVCLLIEDEQLRRKFGENARESAVNNLDISVCVEKHARLYEAVQVLDKAPVVDDVGHL